MAHARWAHPIVVKAHWCGIPHGKEKGIMFRLGSSLFITVLGFAGAMAQSTATPTDPQIAHIAYTAGQIDIAAADLALNKTHNKAVKAFAEEMVRDWFLGKSKFPMAP